MPYYKHVWTAHEVPTDDKLNHIEEGIENATNAAESGGGASGALIIEVQDDGVSKLTLNKTWQEIYDAMKSGRGATIVEESEDPEFGLYQSAYSVLSVSGTGVDYSLSDDVDTSPPWYTGSADGYPTRNY